MFKRMSLTSSAQVISLCQNPGVAMPSGRVLPGSGGRPGQHPETGEVWKCVWWAHIYLQEVRKPRLSGPCESYQDDSGVVGPYLLYDPG